MKNNVTIRPIEVSPLSEYYRRIFTDIRRSYPDTFLAEAYTISRLRGEGTRFAFYTLPLLGRALEVSLVHHAPLVVPDEFKKRKGTELPQYCYELFFELYDDTGTLRFQWNDSLSEKQIKSVFLLRTITMSFSKVVNTTEKKIELEAVKSFMKRISKKSTFKYDREINPIIKEARRLLRDVFNSDAAANLREFIKAPWGRHGPGAVAGKESGASKWAFERWPGLPTETYKYNDCVSLRCKPVKEQPNARVIAVPKDFRGPRIICIEPKENQFGQQGLLKCLTELCMSHPLTSRSIDFSDVVRQRTLCYKHSEVATLDLKDASDHLSKDLVKALLPSWVFKLVTQWRTRRVFAESLDETDVSNAFATMGSAVCFPIQTMVFWAISLATMIVIRDQHTAFRIKEWKATHKRRKFIPAQKSLPIILGVFGDDIICSLWAADEVILALDACGLVVNRDKTCVFSRLRESCGEWVLSDKNMPITRFKSSNISTWRDFVRWVDYYRECDYPPVKEFILDELKAFAGVLKRRWNSALQRTEVRLPQLCQPKQSRKLPDYVGLYAYFVGNDVTPIPFGARKRVKWGWMDANLYNFLL